MYKDCWCGDTYFDHATLRVIGDPQLATRDERYYQIGACKVEFCRCSEYENNADPDTNILKFKKLNEDAKEPVKEYDSACFDLFADKEYEVSGNETIKITTGIALEIPKGYEVVVRSRSSSFSKKGLWVHLGTIDYEYRGEVYFFVNMIAPHSHLFYREIEEDEWNYDNEYGNLNSYTIKKGEAVAQMAIREVPKFRLKEVESLSETDRGSKGFGSTG